jgi:hypothetical protein
MHFAPDVSPAAVLLIFFWPVADTLLAITSCQARRQLGAIDGYF